MLGNVEIRDNIRQFGIWYLVTLGMLHRCPNVISYHLYNILFYYPDGRHRNITPYGISIRFFVLDWPDGIVFHLMQITLEIRLHEHTITNSQLFVALSLYHWQVVSDK